MAKGRRGRLDPEAVLEGKVSVDVAALCRLVHQVNPTSEPVGAAEAARRYRLKSRLQSLLVRRFGESLDVVADGPGDSDVVSLRHPLLDRDACHAVVSELDDDARSWVRWRLDTGGADEAPVAAAIPTPAGPSDDLLRRGGSLLDEYDYDGARACFERELARAGSREAAAALIGLLVEHLADYEGALGVAERLRGDAADDPGVRRMLALAAAHAGRREEAERWLAGVDPGSATDALAAIAHADIRAHDIAAARLHIDRLRDVDPVHPELLRLEDTMAGEQARGLERAEAELAKAEHGPAAEALAREVAARWPESAVARRILRAAEGRRRAEEAGRLSEEARAAAEGGEPSRAVALLQRACALHPADRAVAARLDAARALESERRRRDEIDGIAAALRVEAAPDALSRYARLPDTQREEVRGLVRRRETDWVETLLQNGTRPRQAVEAALALAGALAGEPEDPEEAIAALDRHAPALRSIPLAATLWERIRTREEARRRAAAVAALEEAERALERSVEKLSLRPLPRQAGSVPGDRCGTSGMGLGSPEPDPAPNRHRALATHSCRSVLEGPGTDRATARLTKIDRSVLGARELERLAAAEARAQRLRAMDAHIRRFEQWAAAGDELRAIAELDRALLLASPSEREGLVSRRDGLRSEVRRQWCTKHVERPGQWLGLSDISCRRLGEQGALVAGGEEAVLVSTHGDWLLVRVVDVSGGCVARATMVRTPVPMPIPRWCADDSTVTAATPAAAIRLDHRSGDVLDWMTFDTAASRDPDAEAVVVDGDHVWLEPGRRGPSGARVATLSRRKLSRPVAGMVRVRAVWSAGGGLAVGAGLRGGLSVCSPRGAELWVGHSTGEQGVPQATLGLDGHSLLLVTGGEAGPAHRDGALPLGLEHLDASGQRRDRVTFTDEELDVLDIGTATDDGLVVAVASCAAGPSLLLLSEGDGGEPLRIVERRELRQHPGLVCAADGRRVALMVADEGPRIVRAAPGAIQDLPAFTELELPCVSSELGCGAVELPDREHMFLRMCLASPELARGAVESMWETEPRDPARLAALVDVLKRSQHKQLSAEMAARLQEELGGDPIVVITDATVALRAGDPKGALARLEEVDPSAVPGDLARHLHHVAGLVRLLTGDEEGAAREWRAALAAPSGKCSMSCSDVEALFPDHPGDPPRDPTVRARREALAKLRDTVLEADRLVPEEGEAAPEDVEAALTLLSAHHVRSRYELQSLARLGRAWLLREPADPTEELARIRDLADLVQEHASIATRKMAPVGDRTLSVETIASIAAHAAEELDALQGPGEDAGCFPGNGAQDPR